MISRWPDRRPAFQQESPLPLWERVGVPAGADESYSQGLVRFAQS